MPLAVYGNLIADTIATIDMPIQIGASHPCTFTEKLGGIANFVRACFDTPVDQQVASFSQATVIADRSKNTRTGFVKWGEDEYNWKPVEADWHHIMYLDRLNITPLQLSQFDRVSVDFCCIDDLVNFPEVYGPYLPYIDLLIVSELDGPETQLRDLNLDVDMIVHSPDFIYCKRKGQLEIMYEVTTTDGLNVTGAGDYFAARCLINMLNTGDPNLQLSHLQTLELLKAQS